MTSTDATVASIADIAKQVGDVSLLSDAIAEAVSQQETATREIAESASSAARSTDEARQTSAKITDVARDTRAQVSSVDKAARSLFEALGQFNRGIDEFLGSISSELKDRRQSIRHHVREQVVLVHAGTRSAATLSDISLEGAAMSTSAHVKDGAKVSIDFGSTTLQATVVWVRDGALGVGFAHRLEEFPISLAEEPANKAA
jgi:hypothetical protein